ncbi:uncharacterized, partial [Tachysurus ichikawai]
TGNKCSSAAIKNKERRRRRGQEGNISLTATSDERGSEELKLSPGLSVCLCLRADRKRGGDELEVRKMVLGNG